MPVQEINDPGIVRTIHSVTLKLVELEGIPDPEVMIEDPKGVPLGELFYMLECAIRGVLETSRYCDSAKDLGAGG
jgi:hypothetical protein